jgi:AraC-like DNA-binding protein
VNPFGEAASPDEALNFRSTADGLAAASAPRVAPIAIGDILREMNSVQRRLFVRTHADDQENTRARSMKPFAALRKAAGQLPREDYRVDGPVDQRGQFQFELAAEFPFAIKRLFFSAHQPEPPLTWHTYLEVFVLLSAECRMQMGGALITLRRGDVLVMDHQKLHAVRDLPSSGAEAVVIRFQPEMVRSPGAAAFDHLLLLPFYCQIEDRPHVLRGNASEAADVHATLAHLLAGYAAGDTAYVQTGSRAYFLVLLHHLARHFQSAERLKERFARQQTKHDRLREVFEFIAGHYADRISLPQVAALARLSKPRFHAVFKKAAGMTLVNYLNQVRLNEAARLLQETEKPVVEIANAVGFADQSYFDRRFRRRFGQTPLQFRRGSGPPTPRLQEDDFSTAVPMQRRKEPVERIVRKKQAIVLSWNEGVK